MLLLKIASANNNTKRTVQFQWHARLWMAPGPQWAQLPNERGMTAHCCAPPGTPTGRIIEGNH